jgi:simple sugar transport system ATP-binding protein
MAAAEQSQPTQPLIDVRNVTKLFGPVVALTDVSMTVNAREVHCLLGDNGAGKSTLIKTLSGVYQPSDGEIRLEGQPVLLNSPRDALDRGVATVFQDLAMIPLLSITRNFFMGREPAKRKGPFAFMDMKHADAITREEMKKIGIDIRDPQQAVGTLSGGERQCVAIARAVHHGARILILDEPTSALGVHQASTVLRYIAQARARGIGVIFITHNIHHAYPIADRFTLLNRGKSHGTYAKSEITEAEVLELMAGRRDLKILQDEIDRIARETAASARP